MEEPLFYRPIDCVPLLRQGRTKVYEAISTGELRSIKVGRSRLIPRAALLEYAQDLERNAS
jgi:excisionase family DNA binding protein